MAMFRELQPALYLIFIGLKLPRRRLFFKFRGANSKFFFEGPAE